MLWFCRGIKYYPSSRVVVIPCPSKLITLVCLRLILVRGPQWRSWRWERIPSILQEASVGFPRSCHVYNIPHVRDAGAVHTRQQQLEDSWKAVQFNECLLNTLLLCYVRFLCVNLLSPELTHGHSDPKQTCFLCYQRRVTSGCTPHAIAVTRRLRRFPNFPSIHSLGRLLAGLTGKWQHRYIPHHYWHCPLSGFLISFSTQHEASGH